MITDKIEPGPLPAPPAGPARGPIFVTGIGRSGTSLLRALLCAHPNIWLAQESCFLTWTSGKGLPAERLARYLRSYSFAWSDLPVSAVLEGMDIRAADLSPVWERVLRLQAHARGRPRWGDKDPLLATDLPRVFEIFPDARVIFMVRDPRSTVRSLAKMPFASDSLSVLIWGMRFQVNAALHAAETHPGQVHFVRLEDLLDEPEATLRAVLEHVGEPWHPDLLDPDKRGEAVLPLPWLTPASGPLEPEAPSWPHRLPLAWIRLVEDVSKGWMARFDYALHPGPGPMFGAKMWAAIADLWRGLWWVRRYQRGRAAVYARPMGAAEGLRLTLSMNPQAPAHLRTWPDPPEVTLPPELG